MTPEQIGQLTLAVVGVLGALTFYLRNQATSSVKTKGKRSTDEQERMDVLTGILVDKDKSYDALKQERDTERAAFKAETRAWTDERESLIEQIALFTARLLEAETSIGYLRQVSQANERDIKRLEDENQQLRKEHQALINREGELQTQIDVLKTEVKTYRDHFGEL